MHESDDGAARAAELFRALGNESRLRLVRLLGAAPMTVGALTTASGMSQPLVSQHLRTLRQAGIVSSSRRGKEMTYTLADEHVAHIIVDALVHARETASEHEARRGKKDPS